VRTELTQPHGILIDILDELELRHIDEYEVWAEGHRYRLDCFLPDFRAFIEVDGPMHRLRTKKDQLRERRLRSLGLRSLHLTARYVMETPREEIKKIISIFISALQAVPPTKPSADAFSGFVGGLGD
jgi:very-short-patch-repair endonuclease